MGTRRRGAVPHCALAWELLNERACPDQEITMYEAPKLEKFGTFRELTLQSGKTTVGGDLQPGWTGGLDCNPATYGCRS
jgi:hypothetical protein